MNYNHPDIALIPDNLELTLKEFNFLNKYNDELFRLLNEERALNLSLSSDEILCLMIILIRHNDNIMSPDMRDFLPFILKHNKIVIEMSAN